IGFAQQHMPAKSLLGDPRVAAHMGDEHRLPAVQPQRAEAFLPVGPGAAVDVPDAVGKRSHSLSPPREDQIVAYATFFFSIALCQGAVKLNAAFSSKSLNEIICFTAKS